MMKIGVMTSFRDENIVNEFKKMKDMGISYCQLQSWYPDLYTDENAKMIVDAAKANDVTIDVFWAGWTGGGRVWNFYEGQETLGIVPLAFRERRIDDLMRGADFASKLGVKKVATHMGYIPENPMSTEYNSFVTAVKILAKYYLNLGCELLFETGQETPVTLLRVIEDVATGNLGINLDPANLIMYGKANPVDALDVFGKYVRSLHAKDGLYPTDSRNLGKEVKVGQGKVNFPRLIEGLHALGFDGVLSIEREISGDQQIKDIQDTKIFLEDLISNLK